MGDTVLNSDNNYVGSSANVPNKGQHYSILVNFYMGQNILFYFYLLFYWT